MTIQEEIEKAAQEAIDTGYFKYNPLMKSPYRDGFFTGAEKTKSLIMERLKNMYGHLDDHEYPHAVSAFIKELESKEKS